MLQGPWRAVAGLLLLTFVALLTESAAQTRRELRVGVPGLPGQIDPAGALVGAGPARGPPGIRDPGDVRPHLDRRAARPGHPVERVPGWSHMVVHPARRGSLPRRHSADGHRGGGELRAATERRGRRAGRAPGVVGPSPWGSRRGQGGPGERCANRAVRAGAALRGAPDRARPSGIRCGEGRQRTRWPGTPARHGSLPPRRDRARAVSCSRPTQGTGPSRRAPSAS